MGPGPPAEPQNRRRRSPWSVARDELEAARDRALEREGVAEPPPSPGSGPSPFAFERGRLQSLSDWLRKAGVPVGQFHKVELSILSLVHNRHSLGRGWRDNDRDKKTRAGLPLKPAELARRFNCSPRWVRKCEAFLFRIGYLIDTEPGPNRERTARSGWFEGPWAERANLTALERCYAEHKRVRPRRPIRRKRPERDRSEPGPTGGQVGTN